ncbi:hypothetical protein [Marinomonas ostreistagni]|uniref:Uncharacterized protein n=1 Tax=Marinomonas ostreistagni TaxID=359209 RepID=A0ABS0ZDV7_9GAMM|nr:hypothetical protein [Marinomonas ostreistagni]MBJ7551862.1 hypothetical protein [Marinomonas ostreistagni]
METQSLSNLIGKHVIAVLGAYPKAMEKMDVYICGVEIQNDSTLMVRFPKGHTLYVSQSVTIHLDNRTGVSDYDADLAVYRCSFKGRVIAVNEYDAIIEAIDYQVYYGISVAKELSVPDYQFPVDDRSLKELPVSPLIEAPQMDLEEHDNKIGVLLTYAQSQPHTTVMAFLSSVDDDIFFITLPSTFKGQLLQKDNRCYFAIDGRSTFTFEHAIEWNYSIVSGTVYQVPKDSYLFAQVQELFIAKNPWEMGFFSLPDIEMYHLKAGHVVCPKASELSC